MMYDKGDMLYENTYVRDAVIDEIDLELVAQYARLLDSSKLPYEFLFRS